MMGDVQSLLFLQRTAGNAAVASLFETRSPSPSGGGQGGGFVIQRCAGGDCHCSPEEREAHETGSTPTIQRDFWGSLGDAATSLLPDSIKSVVTGSTGEAHAAAGELRAKGGAVEGHAHSQGAAALEQSTTSAATTASSGQSQMRAHTQQAETQSNESLKMATAETGKSESGAAGLGSIGAYASELINPVGPIVALPEFEQALQHVGSVLAAIPGGVADLGSDLKHAVSDGLKQGQSGGWDCDQSQIMAMAAGVDRAVTNAAVKAGKKVLGEERYAALAGWANERIADLRSVAASIKGEFEKVKKALEDFWKNNVAPLITKVQALMEDLGKLKDQLVQWAGEQFEKAKKLAATTWQSIKTNVIEPVVAMAHAAKEKVASLAQHARAAIGSWWDKLPAVAKNAIIGVGEVIAAPFALALLGAEKAEKLLAEMAEKLAHRIKELSDGLLKAIAETYRPLRQKVKDAAISLKDRWKSIKASAQHFLASAYARLDSATGGRISRITAAVATMKQKISGEVCTVLGDATGPCIEQFVPESIKGKVEADVTLTTNADVTVPVYGVPVKVGQGAALKLTREGTNFTATETGEGLIAVALPKAGGEGGQAVNVDVSGPFGRGMAWQQLTGNSPSPSDGGSKSPSPSGGGKDKGGPEYEGEAGYKANIEMAYAFTNVPGKDKTCDGLGGLTAFLSAQGLSHVLPPPFDALANQAVSSSYADNLTSCIVSLIEYGNASVNLKQDGIGGLEAAVKGEGKLAIEQTKDETEGWVDSITLSDSLGASGSMKLAAGGSLPLNLSGEAGLGATGTIFAKLKYAEKTGKITSLAAGAKLALSLDADPGKVQEVFPAAVAGPVLEKLMFYRRAGQKGGLEVEASYQVTNLDQLVAALDSYFNDTPIPRVNSEGLFNVVSNYMATAKTEEELTVKYSTSETLAKVAVGIDAKEAGGNVSAEAVKTVKRVLYP